MQLDRIAELLQPFLNPCHSESAGTGEEPAVLSSTQLERISMYIDILLRWNARINLTAIRNEEEIVTRHFGESLFAARRLFPRKNLSPHDELSPGTMALPQRLADLGSGAGFPGIPIKLWAPSVHVTLIESNHKKATFLREVVRVLTLTDIDIQNARAESLAGRRFDVVTLRAVEKFESAALAAAALQEPAGRLALLIGTAQLAQARRIIPKVVWSAPQPIPLSKSRVLAIGHQQ